MPAPSQPPQKPPRLLGQNAIIAGTLLAVYFFLFPLPVIAADVVGFSLRNKTKFGKAITNPVIWVAKRVPPYESYLKTSHRLMEVLYRTA